MVQFGRPLFSQMIKIFEGSGQQANRPSAWFVPRRYRDFSAFQLRELAPPPSHYC